MLHSLYPVETCWYDGEFIVGSVTVSFTLSEAVL